MRTPSCQSSAPVIGSRQPGRWTPFQSYGSGCCGLTFLSPCRFWLGWLPMSDATAARFSWLLHDGLARIGSGVQTSTCLWRVRTPSCQSSAPVIGSWQPLSLLAWVIAHVRRHSSKILSPGLVSTPAELVVRTSLNVAYSSRSASGTGVGHHGHSKTLRFTVWSW